MFQWYRAASICYAYLSDVKDLSDLEGSRWFTRGWTLQELLAPKEVLFYSSDWILLGPKLEISDKLNQITNINIEALETGVWNHISIATRMSWAATRQTTRTEDIGYCLMGIFDVHMPLLYGEGKKSFLRLQEEILKSSEDYSLFAWGLPSNIQVGPKLRNHDDIVEPSNLHGLFADSPADFALSYQAKPLRNWTGKIDPIITKGGVEISLPVWESKRNSAAALPFILEARYDCYLCIPLFKWSENRVARWRELVLVPQSGRISTDNQIGKWTPHRLLIAPPVISILTQGIPEVAHFDISGIPGPVHNLNYILEDVYCLPHAQYSAVDTEIALTEKKEGPHTILFFAKYFRDPEIVQPEEHLPTFGDAIIMEKIIELNSRQPRFAVVLGRDKTDYDYGSWLEFFYILDEKEADQDFDFLLKRNPDLVRRCAKKSQIISALTGSNSKKSFLWRAAARRRYREPIQHREEYFLKRTVMSVQKQLYRYYSDHRNVKNIFVDVELQTKWRNLVEKKAVFVIKIYKEETGLKNWKDPQPEYIQLNPDATDPDIVAVEGSKRSTEVSHR
jgi:hypothetical protein